MLNKEIPFLRICIPLCSGILIWYAFEPDILFIVIPSLCIIPLVLLADRAKRTLSDPGSGIILFTIFLTLGFFLARQKSTRLSDLETRQAVFNGIVEDFPEKKEKSWLLKVKIKSSNSGDTLKYPEGSLLIYHTRDSLPGNIFPGDLIKFRTTPQPVVNRGNPAEFNYRFYLESRGIKYFGFTSAQTILEIKKPAHRSLKHKALIIRQKIINMYEKRGIRGKRLALASAIILGEKSRLDPEQKESFIRAGVMHIMAVSGLHAMILSLFIMKMLSFLKKRFLILRSLITILLLWAFAFVTGLTPSVLRATLMFTFLQGGTLLNRKVNGINSILASAFILIIINPAVIFDAGFLLSYSAVFFIVGFYSEFHSLLKLRNTFVDYIWQSISVTTVAQAGTFPLTLTLFNRFPVFFIFTNLVIVPLSSLIVITGCLFPIIYPFTKISEAFAFFIDKMTWLTEYITSGASSVKWSSVENIGLTWAETSALAIFIAIFFVFIFKKPRINATYVWITLMTFATVSSVNRITQSAQNMLIVYNTPGYSTIGIKNGSFLKVYSESPDIPPEVARHASVMSLRTEYSILGDEPLRIMTGEKSLVICPGSRYEILTKVNADFLILTGTNGSYSETGEVILTRYRHIIYSTSRLPRSLIHSGRGSERSLWSVRDSGAFISAL